MADDDAPVVGISGVLAPPENAERETPDWLYRLLDAEFHFTLDAAATERNAKCPRWLGRQADGTWVDGLAAPWTEPDGRAATVFCNPPYSRGQLRLWLAKAHAERAKGATVVMLIPADRSTVAWQRYVPGEEVRDLRARVDYNVGAGAKFASAVVVLRPWVELPWVVTPATPPPAGLLTAVALVDRENKRDLARAASLSAEVERLRARVERLRAQIARARRKKGS